MALVLLLVLLLASPVLAAPIRVADLVDYLPEWPVTTSEAGGIFILSDSPEEFDREGILYQDQVKGNARLFFHHVNATLVKKRLAVMLTNQGSVAAKIEVLRHGVSQPDHDYLRAGRAIQADYFKLSKPQSFVLAPKSSILLPVQKTVPVLLPQAISTGMIDFSADREVRLVVAAIAEVGDPVSLLAKAEVLPPGDPHLRGTFHHADRLMLASGPYNPAVDGPVAITLGDGDQDPFLVGTDATTGQMVRNEGNYGVVYRVLLPTTGKGKIRCYLNPRGGVYAGWLTVKTKAGERLVATPGKGGAFGHQTLGDFELIAEFAAGESLWVNFSPPGASNLPVRLVLVPVM